MGATGDSSIRNHPAQAASTIPSAAPTDGAPQRYVGRVASTRPVIVNGVPTIFPKQTLDDLAQQVQDRFIPGNVEHFGIAPPHAVWESADVIQAEDGYHELIFQGSELPQHVIDTAWLEEAYLPRVITSEPESLRADEPIAVYVSAEPRNYEPGVWEDATRRSPVAVHEHAAWSLLPPLEWLISVALVWSGTKFIGAYLEAVGKDLGTTFATWLRDLTSRAKNPARMAFVTIRIELPDGRAVLGFLPFSPSLSTPKALSDAMQQSGALAEAAVAQQDGLAPRAENMGFLFHDGSWRLGWIATRQGVLVSEWWSEAMPDPKDFLDDGSSTAGG